jgi:outer membrane protein
MKKSLLTLIAIFGLVALAQAEVKIVTVDMNRVFNEYFRIQEAQARFQESVNEANADIQEMIERGRTVAEEFEVEVAKIENPALTESAQQAARQRAGELQQRLQQMEAEIQRFQQETQAVLQERRQNILNLHIGEIREAVQRVARRSGATVALNTQGNSVIFADASLDITTEVLTRLNENAPR